MSVMSSLRRQLSKFKPRAERLISTRTGKVARYKMRLRKIARRKARREVAA